MENAGRSDEGQDPEPKPDEEPIGEEASSRQPSDPESPRPSGDVAGTALAAVFDMDFVGSRLLGGPLFSQETIASVLGSPTRWFDPTPFMPKVPVPDLIGPLLGSDAFKGLFDPGPIIQAAWANLDFSRVFDPGPIIQAAWANLDFSPLTDHFAELFKGFQRIGLPSNVAGLDHVTIMDVIDVAEDGITLYLVPREATAEALITAGDVAARRAVLGRSFESILDDCDAVLDRCVAADTRGTVVFTRAAIAAARAGHTEAAQALAANVLDSAITGHLTRASRAYFKHQGAEAREKLDELQIRWYLVALPISKAHQHFTPGTTGSGVPRHFTRHATVHGVSRRQFSKRNTVQSLMLVTSFIGALNEL